jgi:hypothetical protein
MNDAELRERFAQSADPLRAAPPPAIAAIRRRARRHAVGLVLTSGLVVAVVGLTVGLVAAGLVATARRPDASPWGSARYPAPPGQPYVLVMTPVNALGPTAAGSGRTELRDAATGAVLDVLRPTVRGGSFIAAAAAANDRLFVLGEQAFTGQVSFAELRITVSDGTVSTRLTPVLSRVNVTMGSQLISMTLNAAGTRLALSTLPVGGGNLAQPSRLNVYDLGTGTLMESWRPPGLSISNQQFIGGAEELAVFWPTSSPVVTTSGGQVDVHESFELRLVNTAAAFPPRSSLLADSRIDPAVNGATDGSFSQDGSVALNTDAGGLVNNPPGPTADLLETDAVSGRLLWSVPLGPASVLNNGAGFCGVLWASANGRDLLTQCGTRQLSIVNGKARVVHLAWLFPAADGGIVQGQSPDGQPVVRGYQLASFAW